MIKFKLDQQHRPFWGWVERHLWAFLIGDIIGLSIIVFVWLHFDSLVKFLHH